VDEPSSACEGTIESELKVYGPNEVSPLGVLQPIADGWATSALVDNGVLMLDSDGTNPSKGFVALASLDRVVATDEGLLVASLSDEGIVTAHFDLEGHKKGKSTSLTDDTAYELGIGRSSEQALVVWSTLHTVFARAVASADGAPVADAFSLESGIVKDDFSVAIGQSGPLEFVVVWSERDPDNRKYTTRLAFADAQGIIGEPRTLLSDWNEQRTLSLAPIGDDFALLVAYDAAPVVFLLDSDGAPKGSGRKLIGARQAFDLAVFGDELMVSAVRDDWRDALRLLSFDLRPKAGWLCLSEASTEVEHSVSVSADALGFAAIYRAPDGSEAFVRP
jgi:hypothetical protein